MDIILCLIIFTAILFLFYIKNYIIAMYLAMKLSGPPALPILGNVLMLKDIKKLQEIGTNAYDLYGTFIRCWISIIPFFWIYEPRHLKIILAGKNSQKNIFYRFLHNFIGKGLITNNGLQWKMHRRLIQPYFHINVLENYIDLFTESANDFVNGLEKNNDIKITPLVNKCILSILHISQKYNYSTIKCVLSSKKFRQDVLFKITRHVATSSIIINKRVPSLFLLKSTKSVHKFSNFYLDHFPRGEVLLTQRVTRPWLLLETIFRYTPFAKNEEIQRLTLRSYTSQILLNRRNDAKKVTPECLMDMFIEISDNNCDFTDEDIIDETITFMLAGQDTVGAAVAFALYYIAKYQDVQNKIVKELNEVFVTVTPTVTVLHNMKYLEQCIKESLRLAPTVPIISRVLTEDVTLDGCTFPAGTNIFMSPFITHRLPHHFPDPLKFDPDRFSQENVDKRHPFSFIPFSMGHRNCIGFKFALLEMKIILAVVLKRFQISLVQGHETMEFSYRATLRAVGGVWLRLTPRV